MSDNRKAEPDSTAVRVALWRALHVLVDAPPHVLNDDVGLKLAAPGDGWRQRPDMHPENTKMFRASIVARARFIEDLVIEQAGRGVNQYVILGAGLDTFAQRRPEIAAKLTVFEVDKPGAQEWKKQRLVETGFEIPEWLKFVPVDFEKGDSWWKALETAGFDKSKPAVIVSTGVSMYLSEEANMATLRQIAGLAKGTTLVMSYLLPIDLVDSEERVSREFAEKGAKKSGTPFISFFSPEEIVKMAHEAGFEKARAVPASELGERYFKNRTDGLRLGKSEELLVAES